MLREQRGRVRVPISTGLLSRSSQWSRIGQAKLASRWHELNAWVNISVHLREDKVKNKIWTLNTDILRLQSLLNWIHTQSIIFTHVHFSWYLMNLKQTSSMLMEEILYHGTHSSQLAAVDIFLAKSHTVLPCVSYCMCILCTCVSWCWGDSSVRTDLWSYILFSPWILEYCHNNMGRL